MTLACEDAYSKLVEAVTVAGVSEEDPVGNSLLQIWKVRFGHIAKLWQCFMKTPAGKMSISVFFASQIMNKLRRCSS